MILQTPVINSVKIGIFIVHFYSICILCGAIAATIVSTILYNKSKGVQGGETFLEKYIEKNVMFNILILTLPFGVIGARCYHVFITDFNYYKKHINEIFYISQGGLGIYGGIAFGVMSGVVYCRYKKLDTLLIADCIAPTLLLAQSIGRFGNWFNGELFGKPTNANWGLKIPHLVRNELGGFYPSNTLFHPTFLYESIWDLLGFVLLLVIFYKFSFGKHLLKKGQILSFYIIYYSVGRFFLEFLRIDPSYILFGIRIHAFIALFETSIGVVLFIVLNKKSHKYISVI